MRPLESDGQVNEKSEGGRADGKGSEAAELRIVERQTGDTANFVTVQAFSKLAC